MVTLAFGILEFHVGECSLVLSQRRAQMTHRWRNIKTDGEPAGLAAPGGSGFAQDDVEFVQNAPDRFEKRRAGGGRLDAMAMALEQFDTDVRF